METVFHMTQIVLLGVIALLLNDIADQLRRR